MESEKVKEIKEALKLNERYAIIYFSKSYGAKIFTFTDIITLINELDSENAELKRYKLDWLNSEKMHLQADMEETEFELSSSNSLFEIVSKENKELKNRIAELEEQNAKLNIELDKKDCIDYPCRLIEKEHLKQFAERLKNKFDHCVGDFYHGDTIDERIDKTLKEMIGDDK